MGKREGGGPQLKHSFYRQKEESKETKAPHATKTNQTPFRCVGGFFVPFERKKIISIFYFFCVLFFVVHIFSNHSPKKKKPKPTAQEKKKPKPPDRQPKKIKKPPTDSP